MKKTDIGVVAFVYAVALFFLSMTLKLPKPAQAYPLFIIVLLLGLTTLMVAAVASVAGVIAFLGLIAPHIAFLLLGRRGGPYLPLCALMGGAILLAADLLARGFSQGTELPLSIWTVLFGAPVLTALLLRGREESL